jgi:hypothetical protein
MNNTKVVGASVNVTVTGCSGTGCTGGTSTDSGGYYVIANLNLPAFGGISGVAAKNGNTGSNSETADAYQAASMNITLCIPPTSPSLTHVPSTHLDSVIMSWISGVDPLGLATHDVHTLFGSATRVSPYNQTGLAAVANTTRTWSVRTCNTICCSPDISDSFISINDPPPPPLLTPAISNHDQNRTFYWINYSDPDGDPTYNQYQLDGGPTVSPADSPQTAAGLSFAGHTWRVRTCDDRNACSAWSTNSFTVGNSPPSPPILQHQNNTNRTAVNFNWTSGIDPDHDPTHDEYMLSNDSAYANLIAANNPAYAPLPVGNLTSFQVYYWKVRTCDNLGACSAWSEDRFITYQCDLLCPTCGGGGGGGGGGACPCQNQCEAGHSYCQGNTRVVCGYFNADMCAELERITCPSGQSCSDGVCVAACTPDWSCNSWSMCDFGRQADWTTNHKVQMCHNGKESITVDESAVSAHLSHNDHFGPCNTGVQGRQCGDLNGCGTTEGQPEERRTCALPEAEAPLQLFGIAMPGAIHIPLRAFLIEIALPALLIILLCIIIGILAWLFFRDEIDMLRLMLRLRKAERLCRKKRFGTAYGHMLSKVDPLLRRLKPRIKETVRSHRRMLYRYHFCNAGIFRALQQIYNSTGEPTIATEFGRKAQRSEDLAKDYVDAMKPNKK